MAGKVNQGTEVRPFFIDGQQTAADGIAFDRVVSHVFAKLIKALTASLNRNLTRSGGGDKARRVARCRRQTPWEWVYKLAQAANRHKPAMYSRSSLPTESRLGTFQDLERGRDPAGCLWRH